MLLVVFEDGLARDFAPLAQTRPLGDLLLGTRTLVDSWVRRVAATRLALLVPPHLRAIAAQIHPQSLVNPSSLDDEALFVHALARPQLPEVAKLLAKPTGFVATCQGRVAAAKLAGRASSTLVEAIAAGQADHAQLGVASVELPPAAVLRHPWEVVAVNGEALSNQAAEQQGEWQFSASSMTLRGSLASLKISPEAMVEAHVFFDTRRGAVIVEKGAEIQAFSRIEGPAFIGEGTIVRSGHIRGSSIGPHCRVSGEVEQSVIAGYSNKAHTSFLGHAYVGSWVNIGALSTNSDLKNTYGEIRVNARDGPVSTGLMKVGCFIGDQAKWSVGTVVYSGLRVGVAAHLHGVVTHDVPSFTIFARSLGARSTELEVDSAIRTQARMMARRGIEQTEADRALLRFLFESTQSERLAAGVVKARLQLDQAG